MEFGIQPSVIPVQPWSPSGLNTIPHFQWGSHVAHFFGSSDELRDILVPYFKAGLESNERCLWVTGQAFNAEQARCALRAAVPDLDRRERDKQIEIANSGDWYAAGEKLRPHELITGLVQREQDALAVGYAGLRTNGNCAWVSHDQWDDFLRYEGLVQKAVRGRRMICMCSYCTDQLRNGAQLEVMGRHDLGFSSAPPYPAWQRNAHDSAAAQMTALQDETETQALRRTLERQKRTFDLAMTASRMGTWRYTLADNVCVYDENALRLYELTEARFVHDEQGAKSKFHRDDLDHMWKRVARALDPQGDGRYEAEYRVRLADGGWRWLSAWGIAEFEGEGAERKPIAIAGASRDLTERKRTEELQRLLNDELNHRVKNTLAMVQAIAAQTLRTASDLESARRSLDDRICSMARAHDLLTSRAWTGADFADVVTRALEAFAPAQVTMSGPCIDVSPKHALSLSMALHELATNATKYGALSRPEGHVRVRWRMEDGTLHLDWEETGGPPVAPPTRQGFGSRLLEHLLRELNGDAKLNYEPAGLRCALTARI